jgi:hypothetical protein
MLGGTNGGNRLNRPEMADSQAFQHGTGRDHSKNGIYSWFVAFLSRFARAATLSQRFLVNLFAEKVIRQASN